MTARHFSLLMAAALAELVGCYLPYLYLRRQHSMWLLVPAAASLALFAWLLSIVSNVPGRTYAIYGVVYVLLSLLWLSLVDGVKPQVTDIVGVVIAIGGMLLVARGRSGV